MLKKDEFVDAAKNEIKYGTLQGALKKCAISQKEYEIGCSQIDNNAIGRMFPSEFSRVYITAVQMGLDLTKDPVGAYMAQRSGFCSLIAVALAGCSIKTEWFLLVAIPFALLSIVCCYKLSRYNNSSLILSLIISYTLGLFTGLGFIGLKLGSLSGNRMFPPNQKATQDPSPNPSSFPQETKETGDILWLKGLQSVIPDVILCLESRSMRECKTTSAAVFLDTETLTTTVFLNVSLSWLGTYTQIVPQLKITEDRPQPPQLIIHRQTIVQNNSTVEAVILLVDDVSQKTTYINFPWTAEKFGVLKNTKRWIFWSLADELAKKPTYYRAYGDFGTLEKLEEYLAQHF